MSNRLGEIMTLLFWVFFILIPVYADATPPHHHHHREEEEEVADDLSSTKKTYGRTRGYLDSKIKATLSVDFQSLGPGVEGFHGAYGVMSIWNPKVQYQDEESASFIRLILSSTCIIEVGLHVNPRLYGGDPRTHFYGYWERNTGFGCHNYICNGFVQRSDKIYLGQFVSGVSHYNKDRTEINLEIATGNYGWEVRYGWDNYTVFVGYWPFDIFTDCNAFPYAHTVQFGGSVDNGGRKQTTTEMGSGHKPQHGKHILTKVAYIRKYRVYNSHKPTVNLYIDNANLYDLKFRKDQKFGPYIFFGGSKSE